MRIIFVVSYVMTDTNEILASLASSFKDLYLRDETPKIVKLATFFHFVERAKKEIVDVAELNFDGLTVFVAPGKELVIRGIGSERSYTYNF